MTPLKIHIVLTDVSDTDPKSCGLDPLVTGQLVLPVTGGDISALPVDIDSPSRCFPVCSDTDILLDIFITLLSRTVLPNPAWDGLHVLPEATEGTCDAATVGESDLW
jgi:hypothetical protein